MVGWLLRGGLRMLALAGFLYVAIFVPIGERTLYEHVTRIAGTREARELGGDLAGLGAVATAQLQALYRQVTDSEPRVPDYIAPDVDTQE